MNLHPGLSFTSYDRLFPNQDTMPAGGFGNLIALPLQHQARHLRSTVFVDDDLIPYPDQWALLSRQEPLSPAQLGEKVGREPDSDATADVTMPWEQALPVNDPLITSGQASLRLITFISSARAQRRKFIVVERGQHFASTLHIDRIKQNEI